ncbi:uncharacterized protein E0L32_011943 [Thyridium curvatum]|uniref:Inosine/uridine-preferring nucleoside hydrolase domain-containing protein n=1 Tax=Thyridium curvatum TaxID=1093900 RepID=A0A507B4C8_9PEZI|nr:uncharacterized protein E0L32_011943 [Thyridium curvatum]TPX17975.1 hypothetical protein E0L32_011943 [Thyridium curvatum]
MSPQVPVPLWLDCDPGHDVSWRPICLLGLKERHARLPRFVFAATIRGREVAESESPPAITTPHSHLIPPPGDLTRHALTKTLILYISQKDAFAILLAAYHPAIRLLGISTVFGNASLKNTTYNARSILTAIGKHTSVKVYPGAAKALAREELHAPTDIHGESGLDGTALLPPPQCEADTSVPAVDAMAAALRAQPAGTAWVVATGCMTNVAALFRRHPDLAARVAGVSAMGGAVGGDFTPAPRGEVDGAERIGNWTPFAEFNILADPEAAAFVLQHPVLAPKTTLVPLDITHLVLATAEVQELLLYGPPSPAEGDDRVAAREQRSGPGRSTLRRMLVELLNFFADTYARVFGIAEGPPLHDPIAVAVALIGLPGGHEIPFYEYDPRLGGDDEAAAAAVNKRERFDVTVVTEGTYAEAKVGAQTGRTVAKLLPPGSEGVRIPRSLDIPRFWRVIEECLERADEANAKNGVY